MGPSRKRVQNRLLKTRACIAHKSLKICERCRLARRNIVSKNHLHSDRQAAPIYRLTPGRSGKSANRLARFQSRMLINDRIHDYGKQETPAVLRQFVTDEYDLPPPSSFFQRAGNTAVSGTD